MHRTLTAATAALFCLGVEAAATTVDPVAMISSFTVIALGDYELYSHTPGAVYVGGNLNALQDVGISNATVGGVSGALIVAGDVAADVRKGGAGKANGDIVVGGINNAGTDLLASGGAVTTGAAVPAAEVASAIKGLSTYWKGLGDNVAYSLSGDSNNPVLNVGAVGSDGYAVINLDATDSAFLLGGNTKVQFAGGASTTIVNVLMSSFDNAGKNFNAFTGANNVIFNFHQTTSISLNAPFAASIFAPNANIVASGGGSDMFMVGNDISQQMEVRKTFDGFVPTPDPNPDPDVVPLPAAGWLLFAGIAGLGALRRRAA